MKIAANLMILGMAVTFVLLANQAEIVTKVLGYVWASLLTLAAVLNWSRATKS